MNRLSFNVNWRHFDFWLLGAVILLMIFGVTMIQSAVSGNIELSELNLVQRQHLVLVNLLRPAGVEPLFGPAPVAEVATAAPAGGEESPDATRGRIEEMKKQVEAHYQALLKEKEALAKEKESA